MDSCYAAIRQEVEGQLNAGILEPWCDIRPPRAHRAEAPTPQKEIVVKSMFLLWTSPLSRRLCQILPVLLRRWWANWICVKATGNFPENRHLLVVQGSKRSYTTRWQQYGMWTLPFMFRKRWTHALPRELGERCLCTWIAYFYMISICPSFWCCWSE